MKRNWKGIVAGMLALFLLAGCSGGGSGSGSSAGAEVGGGVERKKIVFADAGWDTIQFHSAVAGYIAKTVFGYESYEILTGSTPIMHEALTKGEVDVHMEVWTDNIEPYYTDLDAGKFVELGVNFDDNIQALYVPRYVIEGDAERGIEAVAPDLKTVKDLLKYPELFPDEEKSGRSRIYGSIPGWAADEVMYKKYQAYGLDEFYEYFQPGSDAALSAALTAAYVKGEPIVGYYWEPTWLMGLYDFVPLEDEPYDDELFSQGLCAFPSVRCTVAASNSFAEKDPEFCEFLKNYKTSSGLSSEAVGHIQDTNASHEETAIWFLKEHDELIDQFLTAEQAQVLRDALNA